MPSRSRKSSSATTSFVSRLAPGARRFCGGFTLLEVLVALAILGIGLGVIFQGIAQGLRLRASSAESVRLALVAERILGELPERATAPAEPEEGEESGCRWRLETISGPQGWTGGAPAAGAKVPERAALAEVRLTVTGPSGRGWELTTLLPLELEGAR